jgi:organic hydroperoxide reductase OsmC/OhrA
MGEHTYKLELMWTGNKGEGTKDFRSYERSHLFTAEGKQEINGSADPAFKGDSTKWNPEELLLSSLSSCHMLWYLHLLSVNKIIATAYNDAPTATMEVDAKGEGKVIGVTLNPTIKITDISRKEEALRLHEEAHKKCNIARSINFPVKVNATIIE